MSNLAFQTFFRPNLLDDDGESASGYRPSPVFRPWLRRLSVLLFVLSAINLVVVAFLGAGSDPLFGGLEISNRKSLSEGMFSVLCALAAILVRAVVVHGERRAWQRRVAMLVSLSGLLLLTSCLHIWAPVHFEWLVYAALTTTTTSQVLFGLSAILARGLSRTLVEQEARVPTGASRAFATALLLFVGMVVFQSVTGGILRVTNASLAIPDFPLMAGGIFPPLSSEGIAHVNQLRADVGLDPTFLSHVLLHVVHRLGGLILALGAVLLLAHVFFSQEYVRSETRSSACHLLVLLVLEIVAGVALLSTLLDPLALAAHVVLSGLVLRQSLLLWLRARLCL